MTILFCDIYVGEGPGDLVTCSSIKQQTCDEKITLQLAMHCMPPVCPPNFFVHWGAPYTLCLPQEVGHKKSNLRAGQ